MGGEALPGPRGHGVTAGRALEVEEVFGDLVQRAERTRALERSLGTAVV